MDIAALSRDAGVNQPQFRFEHGRSSRSCGVLRGHPASHPAGYPAGYPGSSELAEGGDWRAHAGVTSGCPAAFRPSCRESVRHFQPGGPTGIFGRPCAANWERRMASTKTSFHAGSTGRSFGPIPDQAGNTSTRDWNSRRRAGRTSCSNQGWRLNQLRFRGLGWGRGFPCREPDGRTIQWLASR